MRIDSFRRVGNSQSRSGCILLIFSMFALLQLVQSRRFRYYCDLSEEPIVSLQYRNGSYGLPSSTSPLDDNATYDFGSVIVGYNDTDDVDTVEARLCHCWNPRRYVNVTALSDFYCPMEQSHCGIPSLSRHSEELPGCVSIQQDTNFVRSVWPMLVISYVFLVSFLCCSRPGRNALSCCLGAAVPHWNPWAVDRIIAHRPEQANTIILTHFRREQQRNRLSTFMFSRRDVGAGVVLGREEWALLVRDNQTNPLFDALENDNEDEAPPLPTSLKLKTRVYQKNNSLSSSCGATESAALEDELHEDDLRHKDVEADEDLSDQACHSCTICYAPINDGDRVGALPHCDHIFHVICLRTWLPRRNVCPLCLSEDVAAPQYNNNDEQSAGGGSAGTDSDNVESNDDGDYNEDVRERNDN